MFCPCGLILLFYFASISLLLVLLLDHDHGTIKKIASCIRNGKEKESNRDWFVALGNHLVCGNNGMSGPP